MRDFQYFRVQNNNLNSNPQSYIFPSSENFFTKFNMLTPINTSPGTDKADIIHDRFSVLLYSKHANYNSSKCTPFKLLLFQRYYTPTMVSCGIDSITPEYTENCVHIYNYRSFGEIQNLDPRFCSSGMFFNTNVCILKN